MGVELEHKSWIIKNPTLDCVFNEGKVGKGKCQIRYGVGEMECIYRNEPYCPYRVIEESNAIS